MMHRLFGTWAARANWLLGFMCFAWLLALLWISAPDHNIFKLLRAESAAVWIQAIAAVMSAAFIMVTMGYTRRALAQTHDSLEFQKTSLIAQVRPYISIENFQTKKQNDESWKVTVEVKNSGVSPAHNVQIFTEFSFIEGHCKNSKWNMKRKEPQHRGMIVNGAVLKPTIGLTAAEARIGQLNTRGIMLMVRVDYDDSFGGSYRRRCNYHIHSSDFSVSHPGEDANDEIIVRKPTV